MLRLPEPFVNDVGQLLSATKINMLIRAVQHLDAWSLRRMNTFDSSCGDPGGAPYFSTDGTHHGGGYHRVLPFRIWKGGALYKAGCTTLHVEGGATEAAGVQLKCYVNGALKATLGPTIPTPWSVDIDISSGYSVGQPLWLEIKAEGSSGINTRQDSYSVYQAYMTPVTMPVGWTAPTTWADALWDAARLNKIRSACLWLQSAINTVPAIPRLGMMLHPGPDSSPSSSKPEMVSWPLYWGSVLKCYPDGEVYRLGMVWTNYSNAAERYRIYLNGSNVYTSTARGPGTYVEWIPITLSHTLGTRVNVAVIAEVVTPGAARGTQSRYDITTSRTELAGSASLYWTPPDAWIYGTYGYDVVRDTLNSIVQQIITIKSRLDTCVWVWGRHYLQRKWFGWDDATSGKAHKRSMPQFVRVGDRLLVYGTGVTLGYANRIPPDDTDEIVESYTFARQEEVIAEDKTEAKSIYLDTWPDMLHGTAYYLVSKKDMLAEEYIY